MKSILKLLLFIWVLFFVTACKKEVTKNPNILGTIFGNGPGHYLQDVIKIKNDHYVLCGWVDAGKNGNEDGFVMELDENFDTVWYKNYGGAKSDYFYNMASDDEGNILLAGYSYSYGVSIDTAVHNPNCLFYNVMIDAQGNELWHKTFQANPAVNNGKNIARKVIFLKNKTFAVLGKTTNFFNDILWLRRGNIFCYSMDKQGNILWTKRLSNDLFPDDVFLEECTNAVSSEDGNIILAARNDYDQPQGLVCKIALMKTLATGSPFSTNALLWRGSTYTDMVLNDYSHYDHRLLPLESLRNDDIVMADWMNGGIALVTNQGTQQSKIAFNAPYQVSDIYKRGDNLIITSSAPNCIITTDLSGKVLNYSDILNNSKVSFFKTIINSKNEFIVFGICSFDKTSKVIILRYDLKGKLITK